MWLPSIRPPLRYGLRVLRRVFEAILRGTLCLDRVSPGPSSLGRIPTSCVIIYHTENHFVHLKSTKPLMQTQNEERERSPHARKYAVSFLDILPEISYLNEETTSPNSGSLANFSRFSPRCLDLRKMGRRRTRLLSGCFLGVRRIPGCD